MNFTEYKYLWPPRPEQAIPPEMLTYYEEKGWIGQLKKRGTCTLLYVTPDKKLITKTRHKTDHKQWSPSVEFTEQLIDILPEDGWYAFVGELLHNKTKGIKDTIYLFDILVNNNKYLVGYSLKDRLAILHKIFPKGAPSINLGYYVAAPKIWVAETYKKNFFKIFKGLTAPEDEGLVLKDPNACLNMCLRHKSNAAWQIKCRRPEKNYSF